MGLLQIRRTRTLKVSTCRNYGPKGPNSRTTSTSEMGVLSLSPCAPPPSSAPPLTADAPAKMLVPVVVVARPRGRRSFAEFELRDCAGDLPGYGIKVSMLL